MIHPAKTLLVVGALALGLTPSNAQTQWRLRYPLPTSAPLLGATYGAGLFVAVGFHNTLLTSPDGISWTSRLPQSALVLHDVAFGNGKFVAIASKEGEGEMTTILTSTDGINWSSGSPASSVGLRRLVFADDLFVGFGKAIGADGAEFRVIATSADGLTWLERWRGQVGLCLGNSVWSHNSEWFPVAAVGNGTVVARTTCDPGVFIVSTNRVNWTEISTGLTGGGSGIWCGNICRPQYRGRR